MRGKRFFSRAVKFVFLAIVLFIQATPVNASGGCSVTILPVEHGLCTSSTGTAKAGELVTLTVMPDEGYELNNLVVRAGQSVIVVTDLGNGCYTFLMPDQDVEIRIAFTEAEEAVTFVDVSESAFYYAAVQWAVKNGISGGTAPLTFSPFDDCTRAQIVTFLWRNAGEPEPSSRASAPEFKDVDANAYYYKAVQWAVEQGITKGTEENKFSPGDTVSRAQAVTFLYRSAGSPKETGSSGFVDVKGDAYYADAVNWAVKNGVTQGTSRNNFSPDEPCVRCQVVTFLYRYYGEGQ